MSSLASPPTSPIAPTASALGGALPHTADSPATAAPALAVGVHPLSSMSSCSSVIVPNRPSTTTTNPRVVAGANNTISTIGNTRARGMATDSPDMMLHREILQSSSKATAN
ncbi:hypothetical protein OsI_01710 [Oryza sativa Indica Group]|uniref:Uncharacterized protein n=1 Tax=Oryza sativa subsp. indica TaxID=39946 RepID=B8A7F5_ORYSI|nr:hypothetical protein OsI_01710 [Oryza sativa Indica Group]